MKVALTWACPAALGLGGEIVVISLATAVCEGLALAAGFVEVPLGHCGLAWSDHHVLQAGGTDDCRAFCLTAAFILDDRA